MPDEPHTITLTLTVSDADGDGVWVVTNDMGTVYGDADTPYGAVADYFSALGSNLDVLQLHVNHEAAEINPLGPELQREYEAFKAWAEGRER